MEHFFTILIPIAAVAVVVSLAKRTASRTFKCKHCSKEFQIKWTKLLVTEHSGDDYKLLCPHCNTKGWCTAQTKIK